MAVRLSRWIDAMMRTNEAGIELIKSFEACLKRIKSGKNQGKFAAYPDAGYGWKVPTIGWGSTGKHVKRTTVWTQEKCDEEFLRELAQKEVALNNLFERDGVDLNPNQFSALASFAYNAGEGALARSTLYKLLKRGDYQGASNQFGRWVYSNGTKFRGLVRRRAAEKELFETPWLDESEDQETGIIEAIEEFPEQPAPKPETPPAAKKAAQTIKESSTAKSAIVSLVALVTPFFETVVSFFKGVSEETTSLTNDLSPVSAFFSTFGLSIPKLAIIIAVIAVCICLYKRISDGWEGRI